MKRSDTGQPYPYALRSVAACETSYSNASHFSSNARIFTCHPIKQLIALVRQSSNVDTLLLASQLLQAAGRFKISFADFANRVDEVSHYQLKLI